ncbi:HSP20 family small heat-shock protein [Actinomycetospora lutea]|uniref:Hsp20/alpha crystallin family protein n=1 Tax=Actinomycetospora lutea TaxID=663604 RepID=UPI002366AF28|nr:HSP20 family small heat-shock protein [Actinomycetospora lutea]MDD7937923.1 HSP20 family small heat-shock protein [Actinomycetospora lutea]
MLLNHDPFDTFRALERLTGAARQQAASGMPMDAYRAGDHFVASFDLPGVDPGSIDVSVEGNALTVTAARTAPSGDGDYLVAERPRGRYSRQLVLGRDLDSDQLHASYTDGVLTLTIPVVEKAKPRRIEIEHGGAATTIEGARPEHSEEAPTS